MIEQQLIFQDKVNFTAVLVHSKDKLVCFESYLKHIVCNIMNDNMVDDTVIWWNLNLDINEPKSIEDPRSWS